MEYISNENNYCNLHFKHDLLLLADVFEKIRKSSLKKYELCPSHYLSAPALSWYVMLSMTKVELELIPDADMFFPLEKVWEVEFLTFLKDIAKPGVSI